MSDGGSELVVYFRSRERRDGFLELVPCALVYAEIEILNTVLVKDNPIYMTWSKPDRSQT